MKEKMYVLVVYQLLTKLYFKI